MVNTEDNRMTVSEQIKDQFGTLKHFAKVAKINHGSLRVVLAGKAKSKPCTDALIKYGFITSPDDLIKDA